MEVSRRNWGGGDRWGRRYGWGGGGFYRDLALLGAINSFSSPVINTVPYTVVNSAPVQYATDPYAVINGLEAPIYGGLNVPFYPSLFPRRRYY